MRKSFIKLWRAQNGTVAFEFTFLFLPFVLVICLILEICCLIYISSLMSYAVVQAAEQTKNNPLISSSTFQKVFVKNLNHTAGYFWPVLAKNENINAKVFFSKNESDMADGRYTDYKDFILIKYWVKYRYPPILRT